MYYFSPLVTSLTLITREDWKRVQDLIEESLVPPHTHTHITWSPLTQPKVMTEELASMADRYKEAARKLDGGGHLFGNA